MSLSAVFDRRKGYALDDQQEIGFWKGSWLERSRMECRVVVLFIYCWSKNLITIKLCHTTAVDWEEISSWKSRLVAFTASKNCRRFRFARQIYDTLISHRKNYTGPVLPQQWISEGSAGRLKVPKHGSFHGNSWRNSPISSSSVKHALRFNILFFTLFEWAGLTFWRGLSGKGTSILQ